MDDGYENRAQKCGRVEGDGGLDPVGQLEGQDVARADARGFQPAGYPAGGVEDIT
jgi:hypothetical protein